MRKIASWFFIFVGSALMLMSSSHVIMDKIIQKRAKLKGLFGVHYSEAGDLVSMGYLDNVKRFKESYDYTFTRPADTSGKRNIDLYIYGDSYLEYVPDTAFGSINRYHYSRRSQNDLTYTLDPHKKNILIIEYAERFARGEFRNFDIYNHVRKEHPGGALLWSTSSGVAYAEFLRLMLFDRGVNRNLEYNLFGYRLWDNVKMSKASLTCNLFKRAMGDVIVSDDGSRLFLRQTVVPDDLLSSFNPFDQKELQQMIANINAVYDHYRADGFDEVYLSLIPNPVTILQSKNYNGLIPEIQKPGGLNGTRTIDVYTPFSQAPNPGSLYRVGDTHWNNNGMQVWLKVVNAELKRQSLLAADGKP
jgi:hypothetical protein